MPSQTEPKPDRRANYRRVKDLLQAAHDACYNHPDRSPIGMSHGAFSGVNQTLAIVAELEKENWLLRDMLDAAYTRIDSLTKKDETGE